ncbi:hypothetical protein BVZ80_00466 [Haemophilus influenzae]|nr:hypothetical protein BVZ79_00207 [Haemophilus influenzae]PRI71778.1 hypothetical protein BVZ80_00466 [Haemophilus influenzae]PRL99722.1 hypothetical protein BV010_00756 [Haemophilus influenzae]PRM03086.1 hypothetical protein BV009_00428 [Haemophilus influenzae]
MGILAYILTALVTLEHWLPAVLAIVLQMVA